MNRYASRLSGVRPESFDGVSWYRLSEICQALQLQQDKASKLVGKADKRYKNQYGPKYQSARFCYINREGVSAIILRHAGRLGPHAELMRALPELLQSKSPER